MLDALRAAHLGLGCCTVCLLHSYFLQQVDKAYHHGCDISLTLCSIRRATRLCDHVGKQMYGGLDICASTRSCWYQLGQYPVISRAARSLMFWTSQIPFHWGLAGEDELGAGCFAVYSDGTRACESIYKLSHMSYRDVSYTKGDFRCEFILLFDEVAGEMCN